MRVLVSASARFVITGDGTLWTYNASLDYELWRRYLDVYDEVHLLVRAEPRETPPDGWVASTGPRISAIPLPNFSGIRGYIQSRPQIRTIIRQALADAQALQLRIPCPVGGSVIGMLPRSRPFGVEVVADPLDSLSPGSYQHPLRPVLRWHSFRTLKRHCQLAAGAAYVTENALQRRYPARADAFSTYFSDVKLPDTAVVNSPRVFEARSEPFRLVFVGSLQQLYKAPDVLIDAIAKAVQSGVDIVANFAGDGQYRAALEAQAAQRGIAERIHFLGQLTNSAQVREQLDNADLFVLPSRQEGLPKALVEAMARALPCIASTVGGMPELLAAEDLVPPGDADALASKLSEVLCDPQRMTRMSARNLAKAGQYREVLLNERRIAFYQYIHDVTQVWLNKQRG